MSQNALVKNICREPSPTPCRICGEEGYETAYSNKKQLLDGKLCFNCDFWMSRYYKHEHTTIIGGVFYGPGRQGQNVKSSFRGMGGRRFDIEYDTGEKITTFDLWSGGKIEERFVHLFPDNAKFIHGGEFHGNSWNGSNVQGFVYEDWHVLERKLSLQYFTFADNHDHPGCYHVIGIDTSDIKEAREKARLLMIERYGSRWSMQYDNAQLAGVKAFGLTEI